MATSYVCSGTVTSSVISPDGLSISEVCNTAWTTTNSAVTLDSLNTLFATYFAFDDALFSDVLGWCIMSFVAGHCLGRLLQVWRKGI